MDNERTDEKKIVLWIGDEISAEGITSLPTKQEMFEYMVSVSCGETALKKIKEKTESFSEFTIQANHSFGGNIYPEIMIRELGKIKAANICAGVASFLKAPCNFYHYYLALLLEQGISIVTTNYDMCIEKAYEFLNDRKDKMTLRQNDNGVYIYKGDKEKTGTIYHIHGTAHEPSDIGANVGMKDEYFSDIFRNEADRWIMEGYQIYFVGYSARDVYDVTIYLRDRVFQLGKPMWIGYFVTTHYRKDLHQRVKILLKLFKNNKVIRMTNEEFFIDLCTKASSLTKEVLQTKVSKLMVQNQEENGNWKEWLYQDLVDARPYKEIILLRINQTLGVSVEETEPEIFARLDEMPESSRSMYQSLMFRYRYDFVSPYGYVIRSKEELSHEEKLFEDELVCLCNDEYNKGRENVRLLSEKTERVIREYINRLRCNNDGSKWVKEAENILSTINALLISEREPIESQKVPKNRHQTDAILYRLRAAMRAVVAKKEEELESIQKDIGKSYLYSEQTANQVSFCKTMDYAGFCYLCFYYKGGKKKKSYYDKSQKLKTLQKRFKR